MQNVFLKLINLFRSKENSNKPDTIGNIALDQNKQDLDNLKYLFLIVYLTMGHYGQKYKLVLENVNL